MIVVLVVGGLQFQKLVNRTSPIISTTIETAKLRELGILKASDINADVAFAVLDPNTGRPIWFDETYYTFELRAVSCLDQSNQYNCQT